MKTTIRNHFHNLRVRAEKVPRPDPDPSWRPPNHRPPYDPEPHPPGKDDDGKKDQDE